MLLYADPHFGHSNIIEYTNRPFRDKQHMDEALIEKWNNVAHKSSKVLILGDFSFYPKEKTKEIVKSLNGYKMLIMGTHDYRNSVKYYLECGFEAVSMYPIMYKNVLFSHEPIEVPESIINIHAHLHNFYLDTENHICVSVERTGYYPITINQLEWSLRNDKGHDFKIFTEHRSNWYKKPNRVNRD